MKIYSQFVDKSNVNEKQLRFLKNPNVSKNWETDVFSKQYFLKKLVESAISVIFEPDWINQQTIPQHILEHSGSRHLSLHDNEHKLQNAVLKKFIMQNGVLKSESSDHFEPKKPPTAPFLSDAANAILNKFYGHVDDDAYKLITQAYLEPVKSTIQRHICCISVKYPTRDRKFYLFKHKFWGNKPIISKEEENAENNKH